MYGVFMLVVGVLLYVSLLHDDRSQQAHTIVHMITSAKESREDDRDN